MHLGLLFTLFVFAASRLVARPFSRELSRLLCIPLTMLPNQRLEQEREEKMARLGAKLRDLRQQEADGQRCLSFSRLSLSACVVALSLCFVVVQRNSTHQSNSWTTPAKAANANVRFSA